MNGIKFIVSIIAAAVLGAYTFTWQAFTSVDSKLLHISKRIDAVFVLLSTPQGK